MIVVIRLLVLGRQRGKWMVFSHDGRLGRVLLLIDLSRKQAGSVGADLVSASKVDGWSYCVPYRGSARGRVGGRFPEVASEAAKVAFSRGEREMMERSGALEGAEWWKGRGFGECRMPVWCFCRLLGLKVDAETSREWCTRGPGCFQCSTC